MTIVNGEPDNKVYSEDFDPPDRAIILPNITFELSRTKDGGYEERGIMYLQPPEGGSLGGGLRLEEIIKHYPWIAERFWQRIIELEDKLRVLRKAISHKE